MDPANGSQVEILEVSFWCNKAQAQQAIQGYLDGWHASMPTSFTFEGEWINSKFAGVCHFKSRHMPLEIQLKNRLAQMTIQFPAGDELAQAFWEMSKANTVKELKRRFKQAAPP